MNVRLAKVMAMVIVGATAVACVPDPPVDVVPVSISGTGWYEFSLMDQGTPVASGANSATFSLVRNGAIFSGIALSANDGPQTYAEITYAGQDLVSVYTRDVADPPGVGFELQTTSVVASTDTSGTICPGPGLQIRTSGSLTLDGVPSDYTSTGVWTICDPAAASYFG